MSAGPLAPIGVYDSGVGGVSVLRALRAALPEESYVYVADSGHAPYGDRDSAFLESRAAAVFDFFARRQVKAVVLACNTISIAAAATLRRTYSLPIVAMEPAIKPGARTTRSGTVLVLATAYTIQSPSVDRLCRLFGAEVRIILQACPGLAERVEQGLLDGEATTRLLNAYVRPGVEAGADTIVLGCTHYAFLSEEIARIAGPAVTIIEPSQAIARQLAHRLHGLHAPPGTIGGPPAFYTSGSVEGLAAFLDRVGEPAGRVEPLSMPP